MTEPEQRQHQWSRVGPFLIERRLGAGGMGVVYLGYHETSGKVAAVKLLRPELVTEPRPRARLRRELDAASRVPRSCTAPVLGADLDADPPWLATEYIDGPTLDMVLLEHGQLAGVALEAFAAGVAVALRAIHTHGVIHRDLKPANVLLSPHGPRVIDFGIARIEHGSGTEPTRLTQPGAVVGTPAYMAPEQLHGEDPTAAADVFAWAGLVTVAGTGQPPFGAGEAAVHEILYEQPDLGSLAEPMRSIVTEALDKDQTRRPTAAELVARFSDRAPDATTRVLATAAAEPATVASDAPTVDGASPTVVVDTHPVPDGGRPGRRRWAVVGAAVAAAVVAAVTATVAYLLPADPPPLAGEAITIGVFHGWEEGIAATFLWKAALERQGADVDIQFADVGVVYDGVASGDFDIAFDAWLPVTHADYWLMYGADLEDLGAWYSGAQLTIAVNDDAPIRSLAELAGAADEFGNLLVGIEAEAGLTRVTREVVVPTYGLQDMQFLVSSTNSMLLTLEGALERGENVVVTLWEPHWLYEVLPIRNLEDPEHTLGDPEEIHVFARAGFSEDVPQAAEWLGDFTMHERELQSLEIVMFHEHQAATDEEYEAAVQAWLEQHPEYLGRLAGS